MNEKEASNKSLREFIINTQQWISYFKSKWKLLLLTAIAGLVIGLAYCYLKPVQYKAQTDFFVNNDDGGSSAASIPGLSMLGISSTGTQGLFVGDNLIWLYNSQKMIEQTLLSPMDSSGRPILYGVIAIDWKLQRKFGKLLKQPFPLNRRDSTIGPALQRILTATVNVVRSDYMMVTAANQDGTIISVSFTSKDEKLSKIFIDDIVRNVNAYYINFKTQKMSEQVAVLAGKVNEYNKDLTGSIYKSASSRQSVPNPNPNLPTIQAAPQRSDVNVQINATLYSQLVAQLEAAKLTLAKETPIIQIINEPKYPLIIIKPSKIIYPLAGAFMLLIVTMIILFTKRYYRKVMNT